MIATYPVEDMGKEVAEQALDEYLINGKSLREWISILSNELTMLDKIRAEIIENSIEDYEYHDCGTDELIIETNEVLRILDKYKAEGSDKE